MTWFPILSFAFGVGLGWWLRSRWASRRALAWLKTAEGREFLDRATKERA